MRTFATIHWEYLALLVILIAALVFSPFVVALFRNARPVANMSSGNFRLSNAHMWTEVHHTDDGGGSSQKMRLKDGNVVFISVGIATVKVFVTPLEVTDLTQFKELKEFELVNG